MDVLNTTTYTKIDTAVIKPHYDRDHVVPGILHFGIGNFHRAHQACYIDDILNSGDLNWGIIGVSMRSSKIRNLLKPQDCLYSLSVLAEQSSVRVIGSVLDILVAPEEHEKVIQQLANESTNMVTTTITEKGYYLVSGEINRQDPVIVADLDRTTIPKTVYRFIALGLTERYKNSRAPISIVCCDNVSGGGKHLQSGVHLFTEDESDEFKDWLANKVSFASSMVDRVSPVTNEKLQHAASAALGLNDQWPVSAEPFSQWVIEDNFAGPRPALENVGALFVNDVTPYEILKLRTLNASHSIISVLGFLNGNTFVHDALQQSNIAHFIDSIFAEEILTVVDVPEGFSGQQYVADVIARFHNANLPYSVAQVCTDSSQKIQQRWFPSIDHLLVKGGSAEHFALALAAWACFTETALRNEQLQDPLSTPLGNARQQYAGTARVTAFLNIAGAQNFQFMQNAAFIDLVNDHYTHIHEHSIVSSLSSFNTKNTGESHA